MAERLNGRMAERLNGRMAGLVEGLVAGLLVVAAPLGAQPRQTPLQRLQASIEGTTRGVNATWGIFVKSLETGEAVAVGADRQMETMSTIKIPLMVEVLENAIGLIAKEVADYFAYRQ